MCCIKSPNEYTYFDDDHCYIDDIWAFWCFSSPVTLLFIQQLDEAYIKANIKTPYYWHFCEGNPPVTGGFPYKALPCHGVCVSSLNDNVQRKLCLDMHIFVKYDKLVLNRIRNLIAIFMLSRHNVLLNVEIGIEDVGCLDGSFFSKDYSKMMIPTA